MELVPSRVIKDTKTEAAVLAINSLGTELLTQATMPGENALLSPYSIQSVLAMVYAGAEGETRAEMQKFLHYPEGKRELHESFAALQMALETMAEGIQVEEELNGNGRAGELSFVLDTACRLYGQEGFEFRPAFLSLLREKYGTTLEVLDFKFNPTTATRSINDWVTDRTNGKISGLIPPDVLSKETRLVLVNAIYLKAKWLHDFSEVATKPAPFHVRGGKAEEVETMEQQAGFGYHKGEGFCAVGLPYIGNEVQMLILLPEQPDGLAQVERVVAADMLANCGDLPIHELRLFLPKFEMETPSYDLSAVLQDFGVRQAFDKPERTANLDGIAPRKDDDYLAVSHLLHKAYLKLDEKGTEAAAVSIADVIQGGIEPEPPQPIEVRVDRPFLFAIQHKASGACLFMGRIVDPR
jgi:serpin B